MIHNFLLPLSFIILALLPGFSDQEISVDLDVPEEVQAGEDLILTLNIEKGSIESFSRFTQTLPYGLTADRISTENADFSFDEQRIRIIWLKLPPESKISIKYKISVDPRLTGIVNLKGEFAFVEENQRKTIDVNAGHPVKIIPGPGVAESERINIDDFQTLAINEKTDPAKKMEVVRSEPVKSGAFEYEVNLTIHKGDLSKFAKIEEYIPEGYRVVEGDSKNGIFSFNQGMVKILWMNLPEDPEFSVSYRVVPDPGVNIDEFAVNGSFSYITGNETRNIAIVEKNYDLAQQETETSVETTFAEDQPEEDSSIVEPEENLLIAVPDAVEPEIQIEEESPAETEILAEDETVDETENVKELEKKAPVKAVVETKPAVNNQTFMLSPEDGVYYRVQLAAGHHEVNIDRYFSKRKVKDAVKMEFHKGWRKYTTGSFYVYKDARDYRVNIWETTPIKDAFVSAYNNGERITVQEALMVTEQKWYK